MRKYALVVLLLFSCTCLVRAQQRCFKPLSNPNSQNPSDWKDFVNIEPTTKAEGVVRLLRIKDGTGDKINLDFYSITFQKPADPTKTIERVFREIRQHFRRFATGNASAEGGPSGNDFGPYKASSDINDKVFKHNEILWLSEDPKDVVMSFTLASWTVPAIAKGGGVTFVAENGDVVATCTTKTDFIFTTAYTVQHTQHPVSGNRGFGIKDNGDGTWTFYSMGADRETKSLAGTSYLGNIMVKQGLVPGIARDAEAVFKEGHKFWRNFFPNLFDYLEDEGMKVNRASFVRDNSKRYTYPLSP